jgi:outer membrane protein assembly factor BamB
MVADEKESDQRPPYIPVVVNCAGDPVDDIRHAVESTLHDRGWLTGQRIEADEFPEAMARAVELAETGLVVLVDGFEHCVARRSAATRRGFAQVTAACAERLGDRWRMCLALREEFLAYLLDLRPFWPTLFSSVFRLGRLPQSDAVDAITKPGPAFYCYPETELAERVAADLDDGGVLPAHLQLVMNRLYEQRSWGSSSITLKMYEHVGGAEKILAECIEFPLSQLGQRDRRLAHTILNRLVGSQHTTVPKTLERLVEETRLDRERVERVLARLVDLRMVRAIGTEGNRQFRLIHPFLAEELTVELSERLTAAAKHTDAVARATDEWLHTGALIPARLLRRLRDCRDTIWFTSVELEALVRAAAIHEIDLEYWLRRIGSIGPERIPVLRRLLHDTDERVRRAAAEGLSQAADEDALSTLVDGLHDRDDAVRERATSTLESHERDLIGSLSNGEPAKRQRAAHALGIIGREKHVGPLVGALRDDDHEFTDQATRALSQVGPQRAEGLLLQRLTDEPEAPWSVAHALGHLATDTRTLAALEGARRRAPAGSLPKLEYAIGRARLTRGELDDAQQALEAAKGAVRDAAGQRAVEGALGELAEARERASDRDPVDWPTFGGGGTRRAYRRRQIVLPLHRRWAFSTEAEVVTSPVVANGMVYVGSRDQSLYCLDAGAGTLSWRLPTKGRLESTAAVAEGLVVVGGMDGTVHCADAASGQRRWTFSAGAPIRAAATIAGERTFVATRGGLLQALALADGSPAWKVQLDGDIVAAPAVRGDWLVLGAWDEAIRCLSCSTGEEQWRFDSRGEASGAPAIAGGYAYCPSDAGFLHALDLETGEEAWRAALEPPIRCSPAVAEDTLIAGDGHGRVVALARDGGHEVWSVSLGDEVSGSPAIAGDLVFVGSVDGSLRALDMASGEERWREKTAFGIYSSPAIAGELILVAMGYYDVWAFGHEPEKMAPGSEERP